MARTLSTLGCLLAAGVVVPVFYDGVLNAIRNAAQRESVIVPLQPANALEPNALQGIFNIVLDI
jgi:hypothetical protein